MGAWIETSGIVYETCLPRVAPFMGAWIETTLTNLSIAKKKVAPFMGAWIETSHYFKYYLQFLVAPFMGAWIETLSKNFRKIRKPSHPSWVRGLKRENIFDLKYDECRTLHGCVD